MKNLVLSTLIVAAASQAAGCIFVSDDDPVDPVGEIQMTWTLKSTNKDAPGNPDVTVTCPPGADAVKLFALPDGWPASSAYTDTYDCIDGTGFVSDIEPGNYTIWAQVLAGPSLVAESFSHPTTVTADRTTPVGFDIFVDRGFFGLGWDLTGRFNTCAQAPGHSIAVTATDSGGLGFEDLINCTEGEGVMTVTQPLPMRRQGAPEVYTLAIQLLDAQDIPVGQTTAVPSKSFDTAVGNELKDLGLQTINTN